MFEAEVCCWGFQLSNDTLIIDSLIYDVCKDATRVLIIITMITLSPQRHRHHPHHNLEVTFKVFSNLVEICIDPVFMQCLHINCCNHHHWLWRCWSLIVTMRIDGENEDDEDGAMIWIPVGHERQLDWSSDVGTSLIYRTRTYTSAHTNIQTQVHVLTYKHKLTNKFTQVHIHTNLLQLNIHRWYVYTADNHKCAY